MNRSPLKRRTPLAARTALRATKPMRSIGKGRFAPQGVRRRLLVAQGWACHYCGRPLSLEEAVVDHKLAVGRGGRTEPDNLVASCRVCNRAKGDRPYGEFVRRG